MYAYIRSSWVDSERIWHHWTLGHPTLTAAPGRIWFRHRQCKSPQMIFHSVYTGSRGHVICQVTGHMTWSLLSTLAQRQVKAPQYAVTSVQLLPAGGVVNSKQLNMIWRAQKQNAIAFLYVRKWYQHLSGKVPSLKTSCLAKGMLQEIKLWSYC